MYESFILHVFFCAALDGPPNPSKLNILTICEISVSVAWSEDTCDGGH